MRIEDGCKEVMARGTSRTCLKNGIFYNICSLVRQMMYYLKNILLVVGNSVIVAYTL